MTGNFIPPVEGPWRGHNGLRTLSGRHYKALLFTDLWDVNGSGSQRQNGTHLALGACRNEVRTEVQGIGFIGRHGEFVGVAAWWAIFGL